MLEYCAGYTGAYLDVRFNHDGRLILPDDVHSTLLLRTSRELSDVLFAISSQMRGDIHCVRFYDHSALGLLRARHTGAVFLTGVESDRSVYIHPYLAQKAKLEASRVFVAASDDEETFTVWRNERYFYRAFSRA